LVNKEADKGDQNAKAIHDCCPAYYVGRYPLFFQLTGRTCPQSNNDEKDAKTTRAKTTTIKR
jgi:hypothetical protein